MIWEKDMADVLEILKRVWPGWTLEKQIGRGSYGSVFQAAHIERGLVSRSAIKIISVPTSPEELESLYAEGYDARSVRAQVERVVNEFTREIQVMVSLEGASNIVGIRDALIAAQTITEIVLTAYRTP